MNRAIYLPGLNGIRAIAAVDVMLGHINFELPKFGINNYSIFGFKNGVADHWTLTEQGVTMFFVLSGFKLKDKFSIIHSSNSSNI